MALKGNVSSIKEVKISKNGTFRMHARNRSGLKFMTACATKDPPAD